MLFMKVLPKLVYGIKVNSAIQEQQLIILFQVRQRKQLRLERPYRVEGDLELERPIVTVGAPLIGGTLYDDKW